MLVSELVSRVLDFYHRFPDRFPDLDALAAGATEARDGCMGKDSAATRARATSMRWPVTSGANEMASVRP